MEIVSRSLMKVKNCNEKHLHYRKESDIRNVIAFIMVSSMPFQTGGSGIISNLTVEKVTNEFIGIQEFYRKTEGLRIRHEYINISKAELSAEIGLQQVLFLANMMSKYYFYKGFQNIWGIVDKGDEYSISYAINTVSPFDGSKYHYNKTDVLADEYAYLNAVWQIIVSKNENNVYDMRALEFYPYSFNLLEIMP